ncbi:MAG TPA: RIP metalloprotease RseP [Burkholderiales bacterium]|nr:RIP metalloprotease RseP [Burkholderiales bacterium]
MSLLVDYVLPFIVALGVLIVVHEYGHYLVARLCGVKVLRFSVGFGRALLVIRTGKDQTEWVIAAIPFGGYVKMLDEREGPVAPQEAARAFNRQSVGKRFAIVLAGPLFNFAFAILLYAGLFMHGIPEPRPMVAEPPAGSAAAAAGLHAGDLVRAIDGDPVVTWQDLRWRVLKAALQREAVQLETLSERGHIQSSTLDLRSFPADEVEKDVLERVGLNLHRPPLEPVLGRVDAGPGQRAGLAPGDLVTHIDGAPVNTWMEVVRTIQQSADKQLAFGIVREGKPLSVQVTPEAARDRDGNTIGRVGIGVRDSSGLFLQVRYGLGASLLKAVDKTVEISLFSLKMLGKMLLGQVSWKHLSGPVTIADFAGQSAQMGLPYFLNFLALISISLGVLNLLPIPLLDGGHLMYYLIEIAKGKPVSERVMELGQRVGLALLLVMMAFAFYNDLNRLLTG